jgi:hypothetical protein
MNVTLDNLDKAKVDDRLWKSGMAGYLGRITEITSEYLVYKYRLFYYKITFE